MRRLLGQQDENDLIYRTVTTGTAKSVGLHRKRDYEIAFGVRVIKETLWGKDDPLPFRRVLIDLEDAAVDSMNGMPKIAVPSVEAIQAACSQPDPSA